MVDEPAAPASGTPATPPAEPPAPPAAPAAPAAPAPWWDATIKEEPIREYMKAKNYQSPEEVARAAWSANKLLAERGDPNSVIAPKADAAPEEWDKFYQKLGRPETADKYEFKQPEGVTVDENLLKFGKELFFEAGMTPAKAQAAMDKWNKFAGEAATAQIEQARVANEAELTTLQNTWGPELDANKAAGLRVMQSLKLDPKFMEKIEGNIGSATVVELLAKIGRASAEGSFKGGGSQQGDPNNPDAMTPEQAAARIEALNGDDAFQKKYTNKDHPEHATSLALMEKLFAKAGNAAKK